MPDVRATPHLTLGPFTVQPSGGLAPREAAGPPPALRFAWRGRPCRAELAGGELRLAAVAARIPSTAEPGADRRGALAAVADLPPALPPGWRLRLLPDHRVALEAAAPLGGVPPTAVGLVAAMVRFALALDPYLDRLEAAGAGAPAAAVASAPGTAKT